MRSSADVLVCPWTHARGKQQNPSDRARARRQFESESINEG